MTTTAATLLLTNTSTASPGPGSGDGDGRVGFATKHSWRHPARGLPTDPVPPGPLAPQPAIGSNGSPPLLHPSLAALVGGASGTQALSPSPGGGAPGTPQGATSLSTNPGSPVPLRGVGSRLQQRRTEGDLGMGSGLGQGSPTVGSPGFLSPPP